MLPPSSLIIPSRNRPRLLAETVRSVLRGACVPSELIIVDQSDAHGLQAPVTGDSRCVIRHVRSVGVGPSRARNEGILLAQSELVAFLDDDMLVHPEWYRALIGGLVSAGRRGVVTGAVHAGEVERARGFVPATVTRPDPHTYEGRIGTDVLAGGNMAAWRSAFEDVGLFDERLGPGTRWSSAEDNDLGFRLLEAGYRIHYAPDALVYHRAWRPTADYYRLRWTYGLGKGGFYTKHASVQDPHTVGRASTDIARRLIGLPSRLIYARQRALGDVIYVAGVVWGAAQWMVMQRRVRAIRPRTA